MAAATNAATGRIEVGPTRYTAPASPTTAATPRMMSHSDLVRLPVATKACAGLVMASMKAHASTTNAAIPRARKKYVSGVYEEPNTGSRYLIRGTVWSDRGNGLPIRRLPIRYLRIRRLRIRRLRIRRLWILRLRLLRLLGFRFCFHGRHGFQGGFQRFRFRARLPGDELGRVGRGIRVRGRLGGGRVLPAERLVDLHEHLLLPFGELRVGHQRGPDARVRRPVLEDPGLHVKRFRGDAQPLGDLLQDVRARLAQATLDLAQVGVGHPGRLSQLAHRDLRLLPLLPDVLPDRVHCHVTHIFSLPPSACNCKPSASTLGTRPQPPTPTRSR